MKLKEWLEAANYHITEGSDYGWNCFGNRTYSLTYWNGDHDGHSMNVVFDTDTQDIYTAEVCDYQNNRAYRWIDPLWVDAYKSEVATRMVDDVAWEEINWTDLEVFEDWKTKATAIRQCLPYDTRVTVPIDIQDDDLFNLMRRAHEQDITLNKMIERVLEEFIGDQYGRNGS